MTHMRCCVFAGLLVCSSLSAATYYVHSGTGNDANPGTDESPWRTLSKVNGTQFAPGDRILLHSGSTWREQLAPASSGREGSPIVIDRYGSGPMPHIEGGAKSEDTILLKNVQWIEVRNLEVTNRGNRPAVRRGVHIFLDNFGTAKHVVVSGLYIHDVNGVNTRKDNGGIIFRTNGDKTPSRFDGLTIERNIVWKVDRSAIAAQSYHWRRTHWFPSLRVVIRDNYVEDIGGDGIVPWATDSALIEHNIARHCNRRAKSYNAGIWPWSTDGSVFQLNEAAFTHTTLDGQGFDSDFNSRSTLFQYNYSHDNEGGFMLICSPGKRNEAENAGNVGTIVRYNVSRNDGERIFHLSAAERTLVHDNAIYVGPKLDVQMLITTDWSGWANGAVFRANSFFVEGTARYGHGTKRNADGTYELGDGWGPAQGIVFEGNRYYGQNIGRPEDTAAVIEASFKPPAIDWETPQFDPAQPEDFDGFLNRHRQWMLKLFETQFGVPVELGR
jgi:hypothetical protein